MVKTFELKENEKIEFELSGDYWEKSILFLEKQRSGKFILTDKRIIFVYGTPYAEIDYSDIEKIEKCNIGPSIVKFVPTGIKITTKDGKIHKLSVLKRSKYMEFIESKIR